MNPLNKTQDKDFEEKVNELGIATAAILKTYYDSLERVNPPELLEMILDEYEKLDF